MDYKLVKQLKDAGFPQREDEHWICKHNKHSASLSFCSDYKDGDRLGVCKKCGQESDNYAYIPTLEELIKECDCYINLIITTRGVSFAANEPEDIETSGKTPKIAVAKLYIKLNT